MSPTWTSSSPRATSSPSTCRSPTAPVISSTGAASRSSSPAAVLVNTAHGPVVDEAALADALESGTLFAAGLDVFEHEPTVHPKLLAAPRTVLLPHIGSASRTTRAEMAQLAGRGVLRGPRRATTHQPRPGTESRRVAVDDDLLGLDAIGQAELVRDGSVTPSELLDASLARIDALNPTLNAVIIDRSDRARVEAAGPLRDGPFRGVPMLVKDTVAHTAGDPYHCGMQVLKDAGWVEQHDTWLITRLRDAGFVLAGKTNTPELASSVTTEPLAYGPSRNPWDPSRSTGGSSGGSAAAVASGMVAVAARQRHGRLHPDPVVDLRAGRVEADPSPGDARTRLRRVLGDDHPRARPHPVGS